MTFKNAAAKTATAAALLLAGAGLGSGLAQADPPGPFPPPMPPIPGPGVNVGVPGNPLPPGQGYLPPPGHGGPMPQDRISFAAPPPWVLMPVIPPIGTPPAPPLPAWADGLPVFWNPDLGAWGVWDAQAGVFVRI
ncbi:hypothetical protein XA26_34490 [Mycolicibacterium fortuitum]|uniref:Uncharacterized protein n=2 Tax=Mycolicibacterium fortuitum TaxID=1766 RepID=A0A0N9Y7K7_MYCFO|nr:MULTISPECIES: hypothetical protein [Mycolicibacterium]ALI27276.1 hypothetical protein XA26_34490 [Mycolicibacterium fortuitum]NOP98452.1 hypothetical protein [Mycolicibacterium fortuitum]OBA98762.1 hypothetical protein A5665_24390 [Mycolicibacterium fortuitum]OBI57129.1 hypothetical protein A5667_20645 [Mycolicibacterium fortuitum]OBI68744.1 hypothetical protein A5666_27190 [Mycolicibacterium fortuitum]